MKKNLFLLIVFVVFVIYNSIAQTVISTPQTWNSDQSISRDITITDGGVLTINPGVNVNFIIDVGIKVEGTGRIVALGTVSDSIKFNIGGFSSEWSGIGFGSDALMSSSADSSIFEYCDFRNSAANSGTQYGENGGAFFVRNFSKLRISNSKLSNNSAVERGGAIALFSSGSGASCSPILSNNTILYNEAKNGGAIAYYSTYYSVNTFYSYNNIISENLSTRDGGALFVNVTTSSEVDLDFTGNTICNNTSNNAGGGVVLICYADNSLINMNFINNNISYNLAKNSGGGIYYRNDLTTTEGGVHYFANNIICNNSSVSFGGGGYLLSKRGAKDDFTFINTTFARNYTSYAGSGLHCEYDHTVSNLGYSKVKIFNSVFWGNEKSDKQLYIRNAGEVSVYNSAIENGLSSVSGSVLFPNGGFASGGDCVDLNSENSGFEDSPCFVVPTTTSGVSGLPNVNSVDWSILFYSACVNKGTPTSLVPSSEFPYFTIRDNDYLVVSSSGVSHILPSFCQDGYNRYSPTAIDIGAYENFDGNVWLGFTSDWSDENNWSKGSVPAGEDVDIPNCSNNPKILANEDAVVGYCTIREGVEIKVESSTSTNGGSLIVEGKPFLEPYAKYVFERNLSPNIYHYISSPIDYSVNSNFSEIETSTGLINMGLNFNDPLDNYWGWDETYSVSNANGCWRDILRGYNGLSSDMDSYIFKNGDGYIYSNDDNINLLFEGYILDEDISFSATYTENGGSEGFNLVGNPFSSTIAINNSADSEYNFLAQNSALLDDQYEAIYIWNENSSALWRDNYQVICNVGFAGVGAGTNINYNFIKPMQSFMVKVSSAGDIKFNRSIQKHGESVFYKKKSNNWSGIQLFVKSVFAESQTKIAFNKDMTIGLDPSYDVLSMKSNLAINLFSKILDNSIINAFCVQSLPNICDSVICGVDVVESGFYTFSVYQEEMASVSLLDRESGIVSDLMNNQAFGLFLDEGSYDDRFVLYFELKNQGVEAEGRSDKIKIYSSNNMLFVENYIGEITIFDLLGRKIDSFQANNEKSSFPIKNLSGLYIVKANSKSEKIYF